MSLHVPGAPIASKVSAAPIGYRRNGSPVWPIAGGASPLTLANPVEQRVGRRPQTSEPMVQGGPFLRHTRESRVQGFSQSGIAFGGFVNQPLKAVPGYLRYLDVLVQATGGAAGAHNAVAQADAPYSVIQSILFKDAFGQSIIQGSGYELSKVVQIYSGQHGFYGTSDVAALPSFSNVATSGNFTYRFRIPFEMFDGFCAIPGANASAVPQLQITLAGSSAVYSTAPDTLPTMTVTVQESYYAIPLDDPNMPPPDNGSSHQWSQQTVASPIGSASNTSLTLPPLGSYVSTLIFVFRDSTGARSDSILPAAGASIEFWVDGVPMFLEDIGTRFDLMYQLFGVTRPTGVLVYTFRDSVANFGPVSSIDTGDLWLPTTPGTLTELRATWGAFGNAPAQVTVLSGRIYATTGVPYTHLSE